MAYRYPHFTREILRADLAFCGGPMPGWPLPDFDLVTTDGTRIRKRDLIGRRPLLLTCASVTCPMAMNAGPGLRHLYAEFGDRVAFATLYVREAHPGEHYPQPDTFAWKLAHACAYRDLLGLPWPVAVDSLDGDLHRALDPRPNAAYLMATDGTVVFRALASNDERTLRHGLAGLIAGRPLPLGERQPRLLPALRAIGVLDAVLDRRNGCVPGGFWPPREGRSPPPRSRPLRARDPRGMRRAYRPSRYRPCRASQPGEDRVVVAGVAVDRRHGV